MRFEKYLPHYTVEDYNHWEGDWELIEGLAISLLPSSNFGHQVLGGNLIVQIGNSIKSQNCTSHKVIHSLDWIVNDNTVLRPDISVIKKQTTDYIMSSPVIIIEILSPSTALKDRNIKFKIYQEQGVKYYIITDPIAKSYSVFELVNNQYQEQQDLKTFVVHGQCKVNIEIAEALASL